MRWMFAVPVAIFVMTGRAGAADFGPVFESEYGAGGQRAGQIIVYDYQPGVRVRAYWASPWRNRRYFPTTGTVPEYGRDEDLSAPHQRPTPPQSFYREWRMSSEFERPVEYFASDKPFADRQADQPADQPADRPADRPAGPAYAPLKP